MGRRVVTSLRLSAASIAVAVGSYGSTALAKAASAGTDAVEERVQTEAPVNQSGGVPRTDIVDPTGVPEAAAPEGVVVVGIRGSVASANNRKRTSKQIVDSIVSEDVGKLPDNNVPEALSRVTGVQIDRARGQGQNVSIRGLSEIQTTINGNQTNLGEGRSLNLSDIPAELLKSVDVYKTRTADQVEGGIAGTVNVELRRPLDLVKGWTIAGSARGAYDDVAEKVSPYVSLLVGKRFDTGLGEMGFLVNGSLTKTYYKEAYIESESPDVVCCSGDANSPNGRLPAELQDVVIPYRAQYGLESGYVRRPSINGVLQWAPSDRLDFVLEGGYLGSREKRAVDRVFTLNRENEFISNVELMPDGRTVQSMTLLPNAQGALPVYIDGQYNSIFSDLYTSNFETHWRSDRAQINASVQYNWSKTGNYFVQQILQPSGLESVDVDFNSDIYKRGVPSITLNGGDLSSVSGYGVDRFQDNNGGSKNKEFAAQVDLTLKLSEEGLLRNFQTGFRYNRRKTSNYYGYRDGLPRVNGVDAPLAIFPGGVDAELVGPEVGGSTPLSWYRIPGGTVLDNIDAIRAYIQANDPASATRFASELPPSDQGQTWRSNEKNFAAYGQINYGFDIGVPVEGSAGLRFVNTWGGIRSFNFRPGNASNGNQDIVEESFGRGNYVNLLPSATALIRFTPKAQLRLSYTTNVQRPSFYDMRPYYFAETRAVPPIIFAGNPDLEAQREHAFDVSAEYYFGKGGAITLAGFYKKASNFFYYSREADIPLDEYGLPGQVGFVEQLRNAGDGTFAGVEGSVQSFFDFLPGIWRNFGVSLNATHMLKARIEYPYEESFPGAFDSPNTSKWTGNAALFYETPSFSTRVAFNYRSSYRLFVWTNNPEYSWYNDDTYRVDAAVNYTPVKFMTLSLEGTNLLKNDVYRYFGQQNLLPLGVRVQARTVQASVRFRF